METKKELNIEQLVNGNASVFVYGSGGRFRIGEGERAGSRDIKQLKDTAALVELCEPPKARRVVTFPKLLGGTQLPRVLLGVSTDHRHV